MKFGIFPTSSSDSNLFSSIVRLGATAALFTASTSFNSNSVAQAKLHSPENPASNYDKVTYCAHNAQRKQWQNHNKLVEKHRHHYETNQNATRSVRESNDSVAKSSHASRKSTKKTRKQTRQGLLLFNESSARKHRKGNVLFDPPQPFIDDLPTRQARHRPHRQGILFCQSGTYMEILGHESRTRNGQHFQRFQFDDSDDDFDSDDDDDDGNNGLVRGTSRKGSKFSIVEFLSIALGLVSIRGIASDHFLCMNSHGRLYSTPIKNFNNECVFMEEMLKNYYNLYSSCVYGSPKRPWYVALRKTGRTKLGSHTRKRQKSSHFVLIDLERSTLDRWLATEDEHFAPDFYEVSAVQSHLSNGARKR